MREELKRRLQAVTRKLALTHRLRKVALADDALVDRMAEASKGLLLNIRGKFSSVSKRIEPTLDPKARAALAEVVADVFRVVTDAGVVDQPVLEDVKGNLEATWKKVSQATRGNTSVVYFFNAVDKFLTVAMLGSLMQNRRLVDRAKVDPKVRQKFVSIREQLGQVIPQVQNTLQQAVSKLPAPEAPPMQPQRDTTAEESVKKQLDDAEREMRKVAIQLSKLLTSKAEELFGVGSDMAEALDENIFSIFNNRQVNPQLNRDRDFYQDSLHLEHSPTKINLAEFLDTREKKAIYLGYRSFVMAVRALGVVQSAKAKPELVLKNRKLQELVVKAQEILMKRKDVIFNFMKALTKPMREEKQEKGIPSGTFSDFFEPKTQPKQKAKRPPSGMFSDSANA